MAVSTMQFYGEKAMLSLGVLTGIRRSKSCTDAISDITCGHHTVLHEWTITIRDEMLQQKDIWSYSEEYYRLPK